MDATALIQAVRDRVPAAVNDSHAFRGDATVLIAREFLLELAKTLKDDAAFQMNFLMDLTALDLSEFGANRSPAFFTSSGVAVGPAPEIPDQNPWPGPPAARFVVVYHFFSLPLKHRLRVEVPLTNAEESDLEIDSLSALWAGADWLEREVWDMFGIRFRGHPNLKRILMYEEFVGHPLRKDYPVNRRQPLIGPIN
jgi:NADH-quinone oxidoreductase subunit C